MILPSRTGYLGGQMLIAMPVMSDPRFERSVIYLCAHSGEGAMGIVVNKVARGIDFGGFLERIGIEKDEESTQSPERFREEFVHIGGPVDPRRGFVLHSPEYRRNETTVLIDDHLHLTSTFDIIKTIAEGKGPERFLLALGYAGWAPGQLENEICANTWLHCPPHSDFVFALDPGETYGLALRSIGVDPTQLVTEVGCA